MFNEGQRPAVDVGLSVSRVGGKAQPRLLRRLASDLRLLYAQLHELETFARFGAELEPETRQRLERGRRLREALKQPRLDPLTVGHEAATLYAIREGALDAVAVADVSLFLDQFARRLEQLESDLLRTLETADVLDDASRTRLNRALETVKNAFTKAGST